MPVALPCKPAELRLAGGDTWGRRNSRQTRARQPQRLSSDHNCRLWFFFLHCESSSLCTSCGSGLYHLDLLSGDNRIRRAQNQRLISLETGDNFNLLAEIAARRDRCERHAAVFHNRDLQNLGAKDKRGNRHQVRGGLSRDFEMHLGICSREQLPAWVIYVSL